MRLNKSTGHAVRILVYCAKSEDELVKVAEIARRLDITQQNTFKIVHLLNKGGFLGSVRGRKGGVRLARPAAKIRIGDIVRSIELTSTGGKVPGQDTGLNEIVDDALEAFISVLDQHTLADMVAAGQPFITDAPASSGSKRPKKTRVRAVEAGSSRGRRGAQHAVAH
ncbi:MAG: Rrf2 family transcriptional regulator [Hyphomicrobium sp.]|nr:Rrf2 family transcriptional regulator [Hyphomicrobiaceae bacterium]